MRTRRNVLLINVLALPLLLFHFQNCSSAGGPGAQSSSNKVSISDMNTSQLQFVQNSVRIKDSAASTGVDGFCASQNDGAKIDWTIYNSDNSGKPVATGSAVCEKGTFAVDLDSLEQYTCGVSELLTVEGSWGGSASTYVTRLCQPLASQQISAANAPAGTSCELEYSAATIAEHTCAQVCYRDNKVVSMADVDVSQCSSLAASLSASN